MTISRDYTLVAQSRATTLMTSYKPMPNQTSIMDLIRSDMETSELNKAPPPRARAPAQTVRWDFDFVRDEPPPVRRVQESPMETSTPRAEPRTQNLRPRPAIELPRPRASSAPPAAHPAKRVALHYSPVKEEVTPPVTPPRAQEIIPEQDPDVVPDTPSPIAKHGRSRGRGTWRAPQTATPAPGVGTHSKTRLRELATARRGRRTSYFGQVATLVRFVRGHCKSHQRDAHS